MSRQDLQAQGGAFTDATRTALENNLDDLYAHVGAIGSVYFIDPANGDDGNSGTSPSKAVATWAVGYAKLASGKNDVLVIIPTGQTTGTVRTTAALTWAKDATHLLGASAPLRYSHRSRIAPTSAASSFTPFLTISGDGCEFRNFQLWMGFTTGGASNIGVSLTGERNYFKNVHFAGLADAASAGGANARIIKISGSGENVFERCTIGVDTVSRGAANASVEFASGTTRNSFIDCVFPFYTSAATPLGYIGSAAACLDRTQEFLRCQFINAAKSGSTTISGLGTLAASAGGLLLFKDCTLVDITEFGTDATTRGQCYVDGAAPTAASSGIAVNPT